ncbi:AbrB family transcriptional regulator [Vibrio aestuarianus]|uniref:AbrB family transcriptional regulator n=1 Tax=Vibrio aestuarianus TaxID=28171 RepID=UPI00237CA271|nr:AbrB family transcriptional regulator [Vibrio aestuarianus]MDE1238252.1 AbrB family transcriptional regulator [Vibrio aestuarianus]MDE1338477.1 AbrB family transcriptional regulator [Vibrio aestuarianus]
MIKTLALSLCASVLFSWLKIPLGAMFGPVIILLVANQCKLSLALPPHTLTFIQLVLGISVGLLVPSDITSINLPPLMLVGLVTCMFGQVSVSYLWLHKKEQWSKMDSLLGSVPGAMAAVLALNEAQSIPSSKVIFTHTIRLVALVILAGIIASDAEPKALQLTFDAVSYWLLAVALLAWVCGGMLEKIGIPAPYMVTGMVTAIIANSVLSEAHLAIPQVLVFAATSALGALLGIRLKDITGREFLIHTRSGIIVTALSLGVTLLFAFSFSLLLEQSFVVLLMSWVPGSIEAITIAAIYLGLEPMLIVLNHVTRMVILHLLPLAAKWLYPTKFKPTRKRI